MDLTAVIKKGEKQYVALCPELDVVSQGRTVEKSLENLKEAVGVYVEEFGFPKEIISEEMIIARFEVKHVPTSRPVRT